MKKILLSLAAAAFCAMGANAQSLYATGNFEASNWDPVNPAVFAFDGENYTITIEGVSKLKISKTCGTAESENAWNDFNAGCICLAAADGMIVKGENALIEGDGDMTFPYVGDWTLKINSDLTVMYASTDTPEPVGFVKLYVRGDMNSWGASEDNEMKTEDGVLYTLEHFNASVGEKFKIADDSWGANNYGADPENNQVYPAVTYPVVAGSLDDFVCGAPLTDVTVYFNLETKEMQAGGEYNSVEGLASDNAAAVYYNMQGVRVNEPANGLYIVRRGNNVTKEVVRK